MRPPGFLKLFLGARFSKFVVTLRRRDNSSPHKLVGCFSNLPGLSRNGPHKTLGFMETQLVLVVFLVLESKGRN